MPVWAPFAAALAALIGMTLIQALLLAGISAFDGDTEAFVDSNGAAIVLTAAFDVLLVVCSIAIVWRLTGRPSPAKFGLRPAPVLRSFRWILGTFVAVWIAGAIIQLAFGKPEDQDIVTELRGEDSLLALVGFGVMTCVLAPLAEEFFFRGFLFRALAERLNLVVGRRPRRRDLRPRPPAGRERRGRDRARHPWRDALPDALLHGVLGAVHHHARKFQLFGVRCYEGAPLVGISAGSCRERR